MSVCLSGLGGNVMFSTPYKDRGPTFAVQIPLTYIMSIYSVNILSVGQATNRNVKKWKHDFLGP